MHSSFFRKCALNRWRLQPMTSPLAITENSFTDCAGTNSMHKHSRTGAGTKKITLSKNLLKRHMSLLMLSYQARGVLVLAVRSKFNKDKPSWTRPQLPLCLLMTNHAHQLASCHAFEFRPFDILTIPVPFIIIHVYWKKVLFRADVFHYISGEYTK